MVEEQDHFSIPALAKADAALEIDAFAEGVTDERLAEPTQSAERASHSILGDVAMLGLDQVFLEEAVPAPLQAVNNPRVLPYRLVPFIRMLGADNFWYSGSAFIVGPHLLVTAGHNIFFHDVGNGTEVRQIVVYPGRAGTTSIARLQATGFRASAGWLNRDGTQDYGVIRVAEDLSQLGAFTMHDVAGGTPAINVAGYAESDAAGRLGVAQSRIALTSPRRHAFSADTRPGMSGGCVWLAATFAAIAVYVRLTEGRSIAIRLTESVLNDIAMPA